MNIKTNSYQDGFIIYMSSIYRYSHSSVASAQMYDHVTIGKLKSGYKAAFVRNLHMPTPSMKINLSNILLSYEISITFKFLHYVSNFSNRKSRK